LVQLQASNGGAFIIIKESGPAIGRKGGDLLGILCLGQVPLNH